MEIAIIGRGESLYNTALKLLKDGHNIPLIVTSKAPEDYIINETHYSELAKKNNSYFINTHNINNPKIHENFSNLKMDFAVSVNYSGIIGNKFINLFKICVLNAHAGDLPKYRGNACLAWAMINKEKKIGLCIHKMIPDELDSGDIVAREYKEINTNTRIKSLFDWQTKTIPLLFENALKTLQKQPNYFLESQDNSKIKPSRGYPRTELDLIIDWKKQPEDFVIHINVSSEPFKGAYTFLNGKKIIFWRCEIFEDDEVFYAKEGQILKINYDKSIIVALKNGKVKVIEIGYEGKKIKPGEVFKSIRQRFQNK